MSVSSWIRSSGKGGLARGFRSFYEFTLALDALKKSLNGTEKTVILDENSSLAQILTGGK